MSGQTIILYGPRQRAEARRLIEAAPDNAVLTIRPQKRTIEQNSKLWAMLSDVSRAKPEGRCHTPDVWKALFMEACGHAVQFEVGLDGKPFPLGHRSSRLTKHQMMDLITFIIQWGDERGVEWSNETVGPA